MARTTEKLNLKPLIHFRSYTDPQAQLNQHIKDRLDAKNTDRFIPDGFCMDTDAPSVIQRQKEVYSLAYSLSVSCTAL